MKLNGCIARATVVAAAFFYPSLTFAQSRPPLLDTVTVVTSRTGLASATRSVDVITHDEIARSAARSIADVLASRTGVDLYTRSAAQGDLSIRGSTSDQVLVLVDGQRVSDVQSSHYALDLAVPLASVDRIEILRGAASALYGSDAIGGVINIVTRPTAAPAAELRGGSFGTVGGVMTEGIASGSTALAATGDFEKSDGHRDGTDYRIGQGRVTLTNLLLNGIARTNLGIGIRDFGANAFYGPYNSVERTGTATVDSRWQASLAHWDVSISAGTRRHSDHYVLLRDDPSVYQNLHISWQTNGELVARTVTGPLALALGTDAEHDQLSSQRLGGRREWRGGAFAEGTIGTPERAMVDAGARVDQSSTFGGFFSPSLAATLELAPGVHLRASAALGFRAPTWTERYYSDPANVGDSTLHAERFASGEIGVATEAAGALVDVAGFARHAENLIDWVRPAGSPTTVLWHATNVGRAEYRGVEGSLRLPPIDRLTASLFATALRFTDDQGSALEGKYALRPITEHVGLRLERSILHSFDVAGDASIARRATEASHFTGDVHSSWTHHSLRIAADATNLANASWLDASGLPVAGRAFMLSVGWRLGSD